MTLPLFIMLIFFVSAPLSAQNPRVLPICPNTSTKHYLFENSRGGGTVVGWNSNTNSLTILNCPMDTHNQAESAFLECRKSFEGSQEEFCNAEINHYQQQLRAIGYVRAANSLNRLVQSTDLIQSLHRLRGNSKNLPALFEQPQVRLDCHNSHLLTDLFRTPSWQTHLRRAPKEAFELMMAADLSRSIPIASRVRRTEERMINILNRVDAETLSNRISDARRASYAIGTIQAIQSPPADNRSQLRLLATHSGGQVRTELAPLNALQRESVCQTGSNNQPAHNPRGSQTNY
jgi:hypothetical protein